MNLSDNAKHLLKTRYCRGNEKPEDVFIRAAEAVGKANNKQKEYKKILTDLDFLPNSPCLRNAGFSNMNKACLTKDTIIHTTNGDKKIEELYKNKIKDFYVFCSDGKKIRVSKADKVIKTRENEKVYEVRFDAGGKIKLTSDHLVMMRDGSYKRVDKLKTNDSVMPFNNFRDKRGYRWVWEDIFLNKKPAYQLVFKEYNGYEVDGIKNVIHHKDYNQVNDNPDNLVKMDREKHWKHHTKNNVMKTSKMRKYFSKIMKGNQKAKGCKRSEEFKLKVSRNNGMKNPEVAKKVFEKLRGVIKTNEHKKKISLTIEKYWKDNRQKMMNAIYKRDRRIREKKSFFTFVCKNCNKKEILIKNKGNLRKKYCSLKCSAIAHKEFMKGNKYGEKASYNHKVVSIEYVGREDVYDIQSVEKYHNFAANGIIIHNCFVLPIEDSMDSLFKSLHDAGIIFKGGGGCGYNFSNLREEGAAISAGGTSSGAISFMKIFNAIIEAVKSGGFRRGASMGILDYDHPEILNFIKLKLGNDLMTNFNLSVLVDDDFMKKIDKDENIYLRSRKDKRIVTGAVKARDIFDIICYSAWICGDPGMVYVDRVNKDNPYNERIKSCNPCITGDTKIAVADGRGSVSIKQLAEEGKDVPVYCSDKEGWKHIRMGRNPRKTGINKKVYKVTLDDGTFIKATSNHKFILKNGNEKQVKDLKKGDSLLRFDKYSFSYNKKSNKYWGIQSTAKEKRYCSISCSNKGRSFKNHKVVSVECVGREDVYNITVDEFHNYAVITSHKDDKMSGIVIRNCGEQFLFPYESCCLGSINLSNCVTKKGNLNKTKLKKLSVLGTKFLLDVNKITKFSVEQCYKQQYKYNRVGLGVMGFADMLVKMGVYYDSEKTLKIIDEIGKTMLTEAKKITPNSASVLSIAPTGSLSIIADCSASIEPIFSRNYQRKLTSDVGTISESRLGKYVRTAHEVSPDWHLRIQSRWQKWIDNGVSKTINLPHDASIGDIKDIYYKAWKWGAKGITVYRDGCKGEQVYYSQKCDGEECHL